MKQKERPIIFSTKMVKAILDGRKTQTRRPIKPQPIKSFTYMPLSTELVGIGSSEKGWQKCPYGQPGDILWVKETWRLLQVFEDWWYGGWDADIYLGPIPKEKPNPKQLAVEYCEETGEDRPWRSPIFMPKWASRIKLEITGIRVERIQDISERDCITEGITPISTPNITGDEPTLREKFADLWDSFWAKKGLGWNQNPWVWVIEFRRMKNATN